MPGKFHEKRPLSPTPRIMKVGFDAGAFFGAITAGKPYNADKTFKARPAPKRVRTPNCTHITMERVHYDEDLPCPVCGRVPPMRFLYECRQDDDIAFSHCAVVDDEDPDEQAKSHLRQELEHIGLSESVIVTAEQGGYTEQQLEKLKALKQELKQAIADAVQVQQISIAEAKLSNWRQGPSNNDGALNSIPTKDLVSPDTPITLLPHRTDTLDCAHMLVSRMSHVPPLLQRSHLSFLRRHLLQRCATHHQGRSLSSSDQVRQHHAHHRPRKAFVLICRRVSFDSSHHRLHGRFRTRTIQDKRSYLPNHAIRCRRSRRVAPPPPPVL
jgi:hypothetical protein